MPETKEFLLSVVIPCFNEKSFIKEVVRRVKNSPIANKEIILVDDGSTDGSSQLIKLELESQVEKVIYHQKNRGKGAALASGFKSAQGDIVVVQDADLEYDPSEYSRLIKPILEDKADVVYGSRFVGGQEHRVLYFWHMIGNKVITFLSNMMTNLNLTDMETGHKAFRKSILNQLKIEEPGFGFEPEITAKVAKLKCRIYEVGISYSGRTYAEGKKIGLKDGLKTLLAIVKYNFLK